MPAPAASAPPTNGLIVKLTRPPRLHEAVRSFAIDRDPARSGRTRTRPTDRPPLQCRAANVKCQERCGRVPPRTRASTAADTLKQRPQQSRARGSRPGPRGRRHVLRAARSATQAREHGATPNSATARASAAPAPSLRPSRPRRHGDRSPDDGGDHGPEVPRPEPTLRRLTPRRTSVRSVEWPSHGGRRARRPRRPGAQPQGHHGPAPAERADLHHRALGLREVEPCLRHDLRRGAAPLRRVALGVRAPVPADDGEAGRRLDRRPQPGDLDRPEDDVAEPALDGRHGHGDLRLPAAALRTRRAAALPDLRPADRRPVDRLDRRADPRAAGRHAVHGQRAGRARPQGRVPRLSKSSATRVPASRSTASSTCSRSRPRSTRSSSTRSRSWSTGS